MKPRSSKPDFRIDCVVTLVNSVDYLEVEIFYRLILFMHVYNKFILEYFDSAIKRCYKQTLEYLSECYFFGRILRKICQNPLSPLIQNIEVLSLVCSF